MAKYGYFQGGSGPSPIPANFGQLATQGSTALQQGILSASKSITDALKERTQKAKDLKEGGDIAGRALKMFAKKTDGVLPSGETIAEIDNMLPQDKINLYQAHAGFQTMSGKDAQIRGADASATGQENINRDYTKRSGLEFAAKTADIEGKGLLNMINQNKLDTIADTEGAVDVLTTGMSGFISGSREELNHASQMFPKADRAKLQEIQSQLIKNEGGPWKPEVLDVGGNKMVMTSPNSAIYVGDPPSSISDKPGYQDIPDGGGSKGIWDGKKWTSIKHPDKGDVQIGDYDTNGNNKLDKEEFDELKFKMAQKNPLFVLSMDGKKNDKGMPWIGQPVKRSQKQSKSTSSNSNQQGSVTDRFKRFQERKRKEQQQNKRN
jgi:hypothetical protein